MPDDLRRFRELVKGAEMVFIERAHSMPKQGVISTFTYAQHFGELLGVLIDTPHTLVPPHVWQRQIHAGCSTKWSPKKRSLEAARRLFPGESFIATPRSKVPHMGMVESALIALFGVRMLAGAHGGAA